LKFMGYGKSSSGAVVVTATVTAGTAATAVAFWDHIAAHAVAYGIGAAVMIGLIGLMVYAHKHKDDIVA
jgi:hypothetical protein